MKKIFKRLLSIEHGMITHTRVIFTDSMGKKNFKKKLGASLGKNKRETIHLSIIIILPFVSDNFIALTTSLCEHCVLFITIYAFHRTTGACVVKKKHR